MVRDEAGIYSASLVWGMENSSHMIEQKSIYICLSIGSRLPIRKGLSAVWCSIPCRMITHLIAIAQLFQCCLLWQSQLVVSTFESYNILFFHYAVEDLRSLNITVGEVDWPHGLLIHSILHCIEQGSLVLIFWGAGNSVDEPRLHMVLVTHCAFADLISLLQTTGLEVAHFIRIGIWRIFLRHRLSEVLSSFIQGSLCGFTSCRL